MVFTTDDACVNIRQTPTKTISYSSVASAKRAGENAPLIEFVNTGYVIGTSAGSNDEVVKYFSGKGPAKFLVKPNVVTYLGYPVGSTDYRTNPLGPTEFVTIVQAIINDGNLISQLQLYNPSDFKNTPAVGGSLIYLYQAINQQKEIDELFAINVNFFGEVMAEYCYYKGLYTYLLNQYFLVYNYSTYRPNGPDVGIGSIGGIQATAANGPQSAANTTQTVQALNLSQIAYYLSCINSRLIDINGLLTAVNTYYINALANLSKQLEATGLSLGSQEDVKNRLTALTASKNSMSKVNSEAEYRKGIIEYTEEKNRYSNILLGLYAFLNIAAIGVILNLRE